VTRQYELGVSNEKFSVGAALPLPRKQAFVLPPCTPMLAVTPSGIEGVNGSHVSASASCRAAWFAPIGAIRGHTPAESYNSTTDQLAASGAVAPFALSVTIVSYFAAS
jgi:hypothetical protein